MADTRNNTPFAEFLKGLLILLVIIGHLLPNKPDFIYAYHMPLFLGLCGLLLSMDRIRSYSLVGLIFRYWNRMLLPWAVASFVFSGGAVILKFIDGTLTPEVIVMRMLHPHGHLWLIPALFGMVLLVFCFDRLNIPPFLILLVAVSFTLLSKGIVAPLFDATEQEPLKYLGDKRAYVLLSFFYFGYYLRNSYRGASFRLEPLVIAVAAASILRYWDNLHPFEPLASTVIWMALNLSLILCVFTCMQSLTAPDNALLRWIGKNALPIYLWHMLPISLLRHYLGFDAAHPVAFYLISISSIIAFMAWLPRVSNSPMAQGLLFGRKMPDPDEDPLFWQLASSHKLYPR